MNHCLLGLSTRCFFLLYFTFFLFGISLNAQTFEATFGGTEATLQWCDGVTSTLAVCREPDSPAPNAGDEGYVVGIESSAFYNYLFTNEASPIVIRNAIWAQIQGICSSNTLCQDAEDAVANGYAAADFTIIKWNNGSYQEMVVEGDLTGVVCTGCSGTLDAQLVSLSDCDSNGDVTAIIDIVYSGLNVGDVITGHGGPWTISNTSGTINTSWTTTGSGNQTSITFQAQNGQCSEIFSVVTPDCVTSDCTLVLDGYSLSACYQSGFHSYYDAEITFSYTGGPATTVLYSVGGVGDNITVNSPGTSTINVSQIQIDQTTMPHLIDLSFDDCFVFEEIDAPATCDVDCTIIIDGYDWSECMDNSPFMDIVTLTINFTWTGGIPNDNLSIYYDGSFYQFTISTVDGSGSIMITKQIDHLNGGSTQAIANFGAKNCEALHDIIIPDGCPFDCTLSVTSSGINPSCSLSNGSISVLDAGGSGNVSYTWTPPVSTSSSAANLEPGNYTIVVEDEHGCTAETMETLTDDSSNCCTNFIISSNSVDENCNQINGSINITPSNASGNVTYTWDPNVSSSSFAMNLSAGTYSITATDDLACQAFEVVTLNNLASPMVSLMTNTSVCAGAEINLMSTVSGGQMPYLYLWNGPNAFTSQEPNPIIANASINEAGMYSLTVTDGNNCSAEQSVDVELATCSFFVNCNPMDVSGCGILDGSVMLTITDGTSPFTYQWSNGSTNSELINVGAGFYEVTVTDVNLNTATCMATINEPGGPMTTLSSNSPVCIGMDIEIMSNTTGGTSPYSYTWSGPDDYTSTHENPIISNATLNMTGTYSLNIIDNAGCMTNKTIDIDVIICDQMEIMCEGVNPSACGAADGMVGTMVSNGVEPITYLWSNGETGASITMVGHGSYAVTISDATGQTANCSFILEDPNGPMIDLSVNEPICIGDDIELFSNPMGGTFPYTFLWTGPSGFSSTDEDPIISSATLDMSGSYTLSLSDASGCLVSENVDLSVINCSGPMVSCMAMNPSECGMQNGSICLDITGGVEPYTFAWSNGSLENKLTDLGPGEYSVTITDSNGDQSNCSSILTAPNGPTVIASGMSPVCVGQNFMLKAEAMNGTGFYSFVWSGPAGFSSSHEDPIIMNAMLNQTGSYTLEVTDDASCYAVASVDILVENCSVLEIDCDPEDPTTCAPFNGSIMTSVRGGTPPYSYLWSNGEITPNIMDLEPGQYTVTITDALNESANCSSTISEIDCCDISMPQISAQINECPSEVGYWLIGEGCGVGSHLEFSLNNGDWTHELPEWTPAALLKARCVDDTFLDCISSETNNIIGVFQECCDTPNCLGVKVTKAKK